MTAALLFGLFAANLHAQEVPAAVSGMLAKIIPGVQPDDIRPAAVNGFYEISYGADVFYVSTDGRFIMRGDLLDMQAQVNLTESRRADFRSRLIAGLSPKELLSFAPRDKPRHVVHVFTDIDCSFCRQLHREMRQYNDLGIEIRYLAYPRSGPDTPSYHKIVSVWCADDPHAAMTRAKAGEAIPGLSCDNPVDEHLALAESFGVRGTPTIVLQDGSTLPGYVPPARLAEYLDGLAGQDD